MTEEEKEARNPGKCRYQDCQARQMDQEQDKHNLHMCKTHTRRAYDLLDMKFIKLAQRFDREHDHNRKKRKTA